MKVSTNSFTKKTELTSSHTFADKTITKGTNVTKKNVTRGTQHGWEGTNVTDAEIVDSLYSSATSGFAEAGGIAHFKNRTAPPDISH